MNILILIKDGHVGGLTNHVKLLATQLQKKKHKVIIGMTAGDSNSFFFEDLKVESFNFNSLNPLILLKNYIKMIKLINREGIQIIQSENRITSLYAYIYCFFHKKIKFLWANHMVPIPYGRLHKLITKVGKCAVASTIEGKRFLINKLDVSPKKVKVINLGIELQQFNRLPKNESIQLKVNNGFNEDDKIVLLYGRLTPEKGHMFLLDSITKAELPDNVKFVFPGDNDEFKQEIITRARQLNIKNELVFPGLIIGTEWLNFIDLMVLPSKKEGFPLACLEAFAMGVPVIRTRTGGFEDTKQYCSGVKFGDSRTLGLLMQQFFDGKGEFNEKADNALNMISEFSADKMADKYIKLYEKILR